MKAGDLIKLLIGVAVEPLSVIDTSLLKIRPGIAHPMLPTFLEPGEIMMLIQITSYWVAVGDEKHDLDACICLIGGREGLFWCPLQALKAASVNINHT